MVNVGRVLVVSPEGGIAFVRFHVGLKRPGGTLIVVLVTGPVLLPEGGNALAGPGGTKVIFGLI